MSNRLSGSSDIRLREEEATQPNFDVAEIVQPCDIVELSQPPGKVRDPFGNGHGLGDFVSPPMGWNSAYYNFS